MNTIKSIIKEQLEGIIVEKNRKGQHYFVSHDKDNLQNQKLNSEDEKELQNDLNTDIINIAALAKKVYPDHTPEGAQSQLRKKVKNIMNTDSKVTYHVKKKEAEKIRKELSKI